MTAEERSESLQHAQQLLALALIEERAAADVERSAHRALDAVRPGTPAGSALRAWRAARADLDARRISRSHCETRVHELDRTQV